MSRAKEPLELGLGANWRQFTLLVVVNAFVGAMVGLERSVLPVLASTEFHVASTTAILSFIATFGITKALSNLASGWIADRHARRPALIAGWIIALPVPLLILWAPNWWWIVAANALLGVNQGLAWSMTILMKIDLVGPKRRGFAMGLNEFAGYLALGASGILAGFVGAHLGLRTGTAYAGIVIAVAGLLLSLAVRETSAHVELETTQFPAVMSPPEKPSLAKILRQSMWSNSRLFSLSQAGLVNNLNDGVAWGLFPLLFVASGLSLRETSVLAGVYPATWGICQLATGPLSDRYGRKIPIVAGMLLQAAALLAMPVISGFPAWTAALVILGVGTALVYPTLIAAVGDIAHPSWRGAAVGVYRLWRDLGYLAGALLAGALADVFGISSAITVVGLLTAVSGIVVAVRLNHSRMSSHQSTVPQEPGRTSTSAASSALKPV